MTTTEVKETLIDTSKIVKYMDKQHLNNLFDTLMNARGKKSRAFFLHVDIKKFVKQILDSLIKSDEVMDQLNCRQMKGIYTIIGDYGIYPICKLCGRPIFIDSEAALDEKESFSWDHIIPKSFGGEYQLYNTQTTHKICNNHRQCNPCKPKKLNLVIDLSNEFCKKHYKTLIPSMDITICCR